MPVTDTHSAALAVQNKLLSQLPVWRKLQMMAELNQAARQIALESLRERFPQASDEILQRHLAENLLGRAIAHQVYGTPE